MAVAKEALVLALALAFTLSANALTLRDRTEPVSKLREDAFFKQWWPTGETPDAKPVLNTGCDGWKGKGFRCYIEYPIWEMVQKHVPKDATIMEIGARFGTTTCDAAHRQGNSGRLLAVEPDASVEGDLMANLKSHDCHARVLRGVVSSRPLVLQMENYDSVSNTANSSAGGVVVPNFEWDAVEKASGLKFDALIVDCEGCFGQMVEEYGPKFRQVNVVVLEGDRYDEGEYKKMADTMQENGLQLVEKKKECDVLIPKEHQCDFPGCKCGSHVNLMVWRRGA